jgi:hypothetical protein
MDQTRALSPSEDEGDTLLELDPRIDLIEARWWSGRGERLKDCALPLTTLDQTRLVAQPDDSIRQTISE